MQKTGTAIGLDIGRDSVKLIELTKEGEAVKLTKIDSAKIARSSEATLEEVQVIKKIIINLLAKNKIKTKDVVLGVSGQSVFIKFLEILPVSPEKLEKTIEYETQQQIPFSLDEVEYNAHLFETGSKKPSVRRALLVAIKKDRLAARQALIKDIGLEPSIIDVSTLGVYNCVRFNHDYEETKTVAILEIGAQSTDLLIIKGDDFWMRSFAFGGDNITSVFKKKFNMDFAEAEKLKTKVGLESAEIKESVESVLKELQGEISRSIEYYYFQQKNATENNESKIDEILLTGGCSRLAGLDKFLGKQFSCPVRLADPFKMLTIDSSVNISLDDEAKAIFSQAVGLALRGLNKSEIHINLLHEQVAQKKVAKEKLLFSVGSAALALVILLGASTFMRQDYLDKSSRLKRLKGLLDKFSTYQPKVKDAEEKYSVLSGEVNVLSSLAMNRSLWLDVFAEIEKMLPKELWITDITGTLGLNTSLKDFEGKLDLQGKAISYDEVNSLVGKLKASTLFADVKPLSSAFMEESAGEKERLEVVKFSISMKVLPKIYKEVK